MRVAILSEGASDAAALRLLVDAVLGFATEPLAGSEPRHAGWPEIKRSLAAAFESMADSPGPVGLVVVADLDDSLVFPMEADPRLKMLRLRELRQVVSRHEASCLDAGITPPHAAVGLAAVAFEALLRAGLPDAEDEGHYLALAPHERSSTQRRALKSLKYGTTDTSSRKAADRAVANARRLAADLSILRKAFPIGFGVLEDDLRSWPPP